MIKKGVKKEGGLQKIGTWSNLHSVRKGLVELGDLGRNAEVDGTVTDLDDETTNEVRVDLVFVKIRYSFN